MGKDGNAQHSHGIILLGVFQIRSIACYRKPSCHFLVSGPLHNTQHFQESTQHEGRIRTLHFGGSSHQPRCNFSEDRGQTVSVGNKLWWPADGDSQGKWYEQYAVEKPLRSA